MNKLAILLISSPTLAFAGLFYQDTAEQTEMPKEQPPAPPPACQLFDPQAIQNSKRIWLDAEILVWQASVDNLGYAIASKSQTTIDDGRIKTPDFDWDVGVRVGLGIKLPHDDWDLLFSYTHIHADADSSAHAPSGGAVFPVWESPFGLPSSFFATSAKLDWDANVNIADIELGRNCFAGRCLSIRPFFGVRGLFIDQNAHVKYKGGTAAPAGDEDVLHLINDFWGVGLRVGLDSLWALGAGWGIYGNGAASLVSGDFKVHEKEKFKESGEERLDLRADANSVVAIAELALGIQWDYLFSKDRYHFGFKFGWEFNVFFDQNRLVRFVGSNPGSISSNKGDFSFQGLTVGFRFDF